MWVATFLVLLVLDALLLAVGPVVAVQERTMTPKLEIHKLCCLTSHVAKFIVA